MARDHGRFLRIPFRGLLAAVALCGLSLTTHAALVSPTPPAGFQSVPGGWTFTPGELLEQAIEETDARKGKWYKTPGPTLPGGAGAPRAAMRFGPGAARALAGAAARGAMGPAGMAIGLAWLASECIEKGTDGKFHMTCGENAPVKSTGWEYRAATQWGGANWSAWLPTRELACKGAFDITDQHKAQGWNVTYEGVRPNGGCYWAASNPYNSMVNNAQIESRPDSCPVGWYKTDSGCSATHESLPMPFDDILNHMEKAPLPNSLPPFVPYPLWTPPAAPNEPSVFGHPVVVNPNRAYEPQAGGQPKSDTWRQPQGSPKTDPQTGKTQQPVTDWKHKPKTDDPFQMETEPGKVETTDPEGQTEPGTVDDGEGGEKTEKPESDTQDLCEKNPGILACADVPEFDTPEGEIPREDKDVEFMEDNAFGVGACPANVMTTLGAVGGRSVTLVDWAQLCAWSLPLRALVMALASLTALFILMPGGVRE